MSKTYTPAPGRAFINPESRFTDTGLIEIPEKYRERKKAVAVVQSWSKEYMFRCNHCGNLQHSRGPCRWCQHRNTLRMVSGSPTAPFSVDITGLRVIYEEAAVTRIEDELFSIPIDDIIAIIPDGIDIGGAEEYGAVKRCGRCGPAKKGSPNAMILVDDGTGKQACPRCGYSE